MNLSCKRLVYEPCGVNFASFGLKIYAQIKFFKFCLLFKG